MEHILLNIWTEKKYSSAYSQQLHCTEKQYKITMYIEKSEFICKQQQKHQLRFTFQRETRQKHCTQQQQYICISTVRFLCLY